MIGEDVFTAGLAGTIDGIRSMSNPAAFGYPGSLQPSLYRHQR